MGQIILITGGARSGKSRFAEQLAHTLGGEEVLFVATAEPRDEDMARRIAAHRRDRPSSWETIEAPREAAQAVRRHLTSHQAVLLDCLTLLAGNVLLSLDNSPDGDRAGERLRREVEEWIDLGRETSAAIVVVTNEVGLGVIPSTRMGRLYRDLLGGANQQLADAADAVYLMVAGIPVDVKDLDARQPPRGPSAP